LVARYQVDVSGRVAGSVVATMSRITPSSPPAQPGVGGPPGRGASVAEGAGNRLPVAALFRAIPGQLASGIDGPEGVLVLPGPVAAFESHHERQAGVGQFSAEGVVVAVGAVGDDRTELDARCRRVSQDGPDLQLGAEGRVILPVREVAGSASNNCRRRALICSPSQVDSDRKNCRRCTAACWAPTMGSVPARHVSVLLQSRGNNSPARSSRKPAAAPASVPKRSSKRTAYASSGPGAGGHGSRFGRAPCCGVGDQLVGVFGVLGSAGALSR
jgi:hypothetical protein